MAEESNKVVGNALDNAGSKDQENSNKDIKQTVSWESHDKLLGQHKKTKGEIAELTKKLNSFEKAQKDAEENKLAESGEYQKLLELKQVEVETLISEAEVAKTEVRKVNQHLIDAQKLQAVYDRLPGKIKNNKYLNFIDLENVVINPDTGDVDEQSASTVANSFMKEYAELVDTSHVGKLPGNAAGGSGNLQEEFKNLSLTDMNKNLKSRVQEAKRKAGVL